MRSRISRSLYLLGASVLALGLSWALRPSLAGHGLQASYAPGKQRLEQVALLTTNDDAFSPNTALTVKWAGYIYQPHAGEIVFHVPAGVSARLIVGSDTVFDTYNQPGAAEEAVAYPAGGFTPIAFEVTTNPARPGYVQAGLEWQNPVRWQLVPAIYLYPEPGSPAAADQIIQESLLAGSLAWGGGLFGLTLAISLLWPNLAGWRSRSALGLTLIVVLTFGLRLAYLRDYASQPAADVLGTGSDNRKYQGNALDYLRGTWPPVTPFYVQPGMSLWLGALYSAFGPHLRLAQVCQMALGASASLLVFDLGRRGFGSLAGWLAALLWALFALPIFFEAQLLTHGLEPVLGLLLVYLWIRSTERPIASARRLLWVVSLGLALGISALIRPTFLILAPLMAITVFLAGRPRLPAMLGWPVLLAVITCLPIAPVTWHNYRANGNFQLLTSNSDVTLYLGNNRDSTGLGEYSPAFLATHTLVRQGKTTYVAQTWADIRNDPRRWGQLMLRKTALYLGDPELPNNVDFYLEGAGISPLLNALPLRFGAILALALCGAFLALIPYDEMPVDRRALRVILAYLVTQIAVTVGYHVFSRFRAPVFGVLALLGGFAAAVMLEAVRRRRWRRAGGALLGLLASALFVGVMPDVAESVMNRPVLAELPSTAKPLNARISDSLTLVGYDPMPVVAPEDPVFITLYWQAQSKLEKDFYVTVQLFGGDRKVIQADQPIGTGSFPDHPTSQWRPGQIVRDTIYMEMPSDAPAPLALALLVAAYDRESGARLGETRFGVLPLTRRQPLVMPQEAAPVGATIGTATLSGYAIRNRALTLYWQAGPPMPEDGVIFIHLFDSQGKFVAGSDTRPVNGLYSTLAWQPGEGIVDEHPLPASLPSGQYSISVGMYESTTQARFTVVDAGGEALPNGELPLGTIAIP